MKEITIAEVRRKLSRLDELLAREGELIVTRHGKPIARLSPAESRTIPPLADFRSRFPTLEVGSEHHVRAERDDR